MHELDLNLKKRTEELGEDLGEALKNQWVFFIPDAVVVCTLVYNAYRMWSFNSFFFVIVAIHIANRATQLGRVNHLAYMLVKMMTHAVTSWEYWSDKALKLTAEKAKKEITKK